jgi:hypothetical protein
MRDQVLGGMRGQVLGGMRGQLPGPGATTGRRDR